MKYLCFSILQIPVTIAAVCGFNYYAACLFGAAVFLYLSAPVEMVRVQINNYPIKGDGDGK